MQMVKILQKILYRLMWEWRPLGFFCLDLQEVPKLVLIWRTSCPLREGRYPADEETKEDEGIYSKSYNKSVQEIWVEFGMSWLCDGFFLITSAIRYALIAKHKTMKGILIFQDLRRFYLE